MKLVQAASRAASLALISFPLQIVAQSSNQNVTLRFFEDSQEDSCDYGNSSSALTFTTSSIPLIWRCFNFAELFGGNATQGFVNQTAHQGAGVQGESGIHWQLENVKSYDSQRNYSSVLYHQHVANPASDDQKPGKYAERRVTTYPGIDCSEKDPTSNETLLPWYGFSCWSEDSGSCGTTPYKIASFTIQPGPKDDEKDGKCWTFAEQGAAARPFSSSQTIIGAFLSASLAIWLAL